ncbi:hypothetical protein [Proteus phage PM2]|uniref:Uncharacterized protein n=1 Tax=Proteus phage PM2 TaxID=2025809 RepID=A0A249XWP4_9CAUD|nr:hypothetical protein KNT71_gp251 [Proteus phage PM2]ASZ76381.1 hypothetical protein [Proteus phage PM2]
MNINEAFSLFKEQNKIGFKEIYANDPELEIHPKLMQGTPKEDMIGNLISVGDIVSFSSTGPWKGISIGVILGFTKEGFRVAVYEYYHPRDYDKDVFAYIMNTPHQVILVRKTKRVYQ